MAQNKVANIQPIALTSTLTTTILNCGVTSMAGPTGITIGQPYILIKHRRVTNKTTAAVNVSLFKGSSGGDAAGTEIGWSAVPVPPNSYLDFYGLIRLDSGDYLTGGAGANTALTLTIDGEVGISG